MSYASNPMLNAYWGKVVPRMLRVVAWAQGVKPSLLESTKRHYNTSGKVLTTPAFWGKIALIEALQVYWPKIPVGTIGVHLGLHHIPDRRIIDRAMGECRANGSYRDLVVDISKRIGPYVDEWRREYRAVDRLFRSTVAKQGKTVVRSRFLSAQEAAELFKGAKYEDDPRAVNEPRGRLKAPEPYFSGVSSPQGW